MNHRDVAEFADDLKGLARQCPKCKIIAHHGVKGRKPQDIICPNCDNEFTVQKYKRGERPKACILTEIDIAEEEARNSDIGLIK